ncbi:peptidoglycan DD-metalloendopeptidase family protein [Streptomyces sp. H27-H1]|nr:peptidoglycan DD-metalloendopeptidase family protein [Streptomyces sp. H27-H1]
MRTPAPEKPESTGGGTDQAAGTYTIKPGDTLSGIAQAHSLDGWHPLHDANKSAIPDPNLISPGHKLVVPEGGKAAAPQEKKAKPVLQEKKAAPAKGPKAVVPVEGYVSAHYKMAGSWALGFHTGIDYAAPQGTPVSAVVDGTVRSAGVNGAFGNQVVVEHQVTVDGKNQTRYSSYSHLSRIDVQPGDRVDAGTQVGLVGSTGRSTGPHLHFEVGTAADTYSSHTDPGAFLQSQGLGPVQAR